VLLLCRPPARADESVEVEYIFSSCGGNYIFVRRPTSNNIVALPMKNIKNTFMLSNVCMYRMKKNESKEDHITKAGWIYGCAEWDCGFTRQHLMACKYFIVHHYWRMCMTLSQKKKYVPFVQIFFLVQISINYIENSFVV
jgi:hypothetical protein